MKIRITLFLLATLYLGFLTPILAQLPSSADWAVQKQGFVCETSINGLKNCPDTIQQGNYEDFAKIKFQLSNAENPECELNPNDITCSNAGSISMKVYLFHTVFVNSNRTELIKVVVSNQNGVLNTFKTIEQLSSNDILVKNKIVELAEAHIKMASGSTYTETVTGDVINQYGVPIEQFPSIAGQWSGNSFPFGCSTASDALTANPIISQADGINGANCQSRLKNSIQHSVGGLDSDTMFMVRVFDNVTGNLGATSFNINLGKLLEGGLTVVLKDGSRAAYDLTIDAGGALIATLNKERSTTINGTSFKEFEEQAKNAGDPFTRGYDFPEMVNYLALTGQATQCTFDIAGYKHVIEYTTKRLPDGNIVLDTVYSYTITPTYIRNCGQQVQMRGIDVP